MIDTIKRSLSTDTLIAMVISAILAAGLIALDILGIIYLTI